MGDQGDEVMFPKHHVRPAAQQVLTPDSNSYLATILSHGLYGLGAALVWTPAAAIPVQYTKRSYAIGFVGSGSGLGGVAYPFLLRALWARLGFQRGMLALAGINLALTIPSWIFLRSPRGGVKPPPWRDFFRELVRPQAPSKGLFASPVPSPPNSAMNSAAPSVVSSPVPSRPASVASDLDKKGAEVRKEPVKVGLFTDPEQPRFRATYLFLLAGVALSMLNMFSPYFDAALLPVNSPVAVLQAGSAVGRFSSGLLADRFGVWRTFLCASMCCAASLLAFWLPVALGAGGVQALSVVGLVAYGLSSGAWVTLVSASCAAISRRRTGARIGLLWTVVSLPILPGPVLCSVLLEKSKAGMIAFCAATFILGSAVTSVPALRRRIRKHKRDVEERAAAEKGEKSEQTDEKSEEEHREEVQA